MNKTRDSTKEEPFIVFDDEHETIKIKTDQGNYVNIHSDMKLCDTGLDGKDKKKCANCGFLPERDRHLFMCSWCKEIYYCDRKCLKYHWPIIHKYQCNKKYK